jgi:hypothetical protein
MMLTIELSPKDALLIIDMLPLASVLNADARRAALEFLEAIEEAKKQAAENGDPFEGKDVAMR